MLGEGGRSRVYSFHWQRLEVNKVTIVGLKKTQQSKRRNMGDPPVPSFCGVLLSVSPEGPIPVVFSLTTSPLKSERAGLERGETNATHTARLRLVARHPPGGCDAVERVAVDDDVLESGGDTVPVSKAVWIVLFIYFIYFCLFCVVVGILSCVHF